MEPLSFTKYVHWCWLPITFCLISLCCLNCPVKSFADRLLATLDEYTTRSSLWHDKFSTVIVIVETLKHIWVLNIFILKISNPDAVVRAWIHVVTLLSVKYSVCSLYTLPNGKCFVVFVKMNAKRKEKHLTKEFYLNTIKPILLVKWL